MDGLAVLGLVLLGWLIVMPILGLVGFARAGRVSRELELLRAQITEQHQSGAGAIKTSPAPASSPEPVAEPAPVPVPVPTPEPVPAAAAPPPRIAASTPPLTPKPLRKTRDWERQIAANWMIWAGGIALAVGGLFLVALAIEAGLFGPLARTLAAGALGAGLIAAALRASDLPIVKSADNQIRHLPSILAGAGVISLYGACFATGALYHFVPPLVALGMMAVVSALAIVLAYRFGQLIAVLGLSGAYLAPFFTGADGGSALTLLPYITVITGAGLVLVRLAHWRLLTWVSLVGTALWAIISLEEAASSSDWIVPAFVLAAGLLALGLAEDDARKPLPHQETLANPIRAIRLVGESLIAVHLFWALAGGIIFLVGFDQPAAAGAAAGLVTLAGIGLFAGGLRPGFSLLASLGAGVTLAALVFWSGFPITIGPACLVAGAGFGLVGTALMPQQAVKAPLALPAALMPPVTLFIAFWRHTAFEPGIVWGLGALLIACSLGLVLDGLQRRDPGFGRYPGAAAFYALGIILSAALAPFLLFGGLWLGTAMAVVAVGLAIITARFDLPVMRLSGPVAVALAIALLVRPGMLRGLEISPVPILNELTLGFGLAIAALLAGAWFTAGRPRLQRTYQGGAIILAFSLLGLTIRHISGGGALYGPFAGLGEASAYAVSYLGMAVSLAWRFGKGHVIWRTAEYIALAAGIYGLLAVSINADDLPEKNIIILNLLFPALAMPAMVLAAYAAVLRRAGRAQFALVAGCGAMLVGFIWVTLETSRFNVESWGSRDWSDGLWLFSVSWIVYAFGLLFWGVWKHRTTARYASLGVLLISIGKVFLIDMASLQGLARAGSFIGLGLALIGIALFYQRYVFGLRGPDVKTMPEAAA